MASTYLTRTAGTPTLNTKYTLSFWVKRHKLTYSECFLFDAREDGNNRFKLSFQSADKIECFNSHGGSDTMAFVTDRKFRDISAFYHIVLAVDTTDSTAGDRFKLYVNGTRETSFASSTNGTLDDANNVINENSRALTIGAYNGGSSYSNHADVSLTHVHFIDGLAYAPTVFAETDSTSGLWVPITNPSVTYGNNGYFLKFENSGAMGTDSSGNTNTFTPAGTLTQNKDTPTNNYAVLNHLHQLGNSQATLTNGNLTYTGHSSTNYSGVHSSLAASSGKWYAEFKCTGGSGAVDMMMGAGNGLFNATAPGAGSQDYVIFGYDGKIYNSGSGSTYGSALTSGDIICVAMDLDNNKIYYRKNEDAWFNSGVPTSGSTGTGAQTLATSSTGVYHFLIGDYGSSGTPVCDANFGSGYFGTTAVSSANADANGHGAFEYAVPTGYYAMNTKNIKEFG